MKKLFLLTVATAMQFTIVAQSYNMNIKLSNGEIFSYPTDDIEEVYFAIPEPPAELENKTIEVNGISFNMIPVEGGNFKMGLIEEPDVETQPDAVFQQVELSTFYIGETEVTQELWEAVMGENPSKFIAEKQPVEQINIEDCLAFIEKLNELTGLTFRIPTEAEWEFAAKGGNKSMNYTYAGSNNIDDVAWYSGNCVTIQDVAQKQPNELGIYDMSGNVWEWCADWYGDYITGETLVNPTGPETGTYQTTRGGGFGHPEKNHKVTHRGYTTDTRRDVARGLRLVLSE